MSAVPPGAWALARSESDLQARRVIDFELWCGRRLGVDLFARTSDAALRRERLRALLIERALADTAARRRQDGTDETWREVFRRVYGVTLTPTA